MSTISNTTYNTQQTLGRFDNYRWGQTFLNNTGDLKIDKVTIKMYKSGSPSGTITVEVYAVDVNNYPTGSALGSATKSSSTVSTTLTDYDFDLNITVENNKTYSIVVYETYNSTNYCSWAYSSSGDVYTGGRLIYSTNGGSSWNQEVKQDFYFIVTLSSGVTINSKFFQLF